MPLELWVVVTRTPSGDMNLFGPYGARNVAESAARTLYGMLNYDSGVSVAVSKIHRPDPLLRIYQRARERGVYIYGGDERDSEAERSEGGGQSR